MDRSAISALNMGNLKDWSSILSGGDWKKTGLLRVRIFECALKSGSPRSDASKCQPANKQVLPKNIKQLTPQDVIRVTISGAVYIRYLTH